MADEIKAGDIVQIAPETTNLDFAGCLMIVTEVKNWGVVGYVASPTGDFYYRAAFGAFAFTGGKIKWTKD